MMGKLLSSEIAPRKLIISAAEHLHFYSTINSFVKSGSKDSIRCIGGTYKLLRGYPPSPQNIDEPNVHRGHPWRVFIANPTLSAEY
jgi:hypothetical protein